MVTGVDNNGLFDSTEGMHMRTIDRIQEHTIVSTLTTSFQHAVFTALAMSLDRLRNKDLENPATAPQISFSWLVPRALGAAMLAVPELMLPGSGASCFPLVLVSM
jgi:hypothetical protein